MEEEKGKGKDSKELKLRDWLGRRGKSPKFKLKEPLQYNPLPPSSHTLFLIAPNSLATSESYDCSKIMSRIDVTKN